MKLPIDEATDQQLREFAAIILQVEGVTDTSSRDEAIAAIQTSWQNDFIMVDGPQIGDMNELIQAESVQHRVDHVGGNNAAYADDPKVRLKIRETDLPGGKDPVPVGVNGKTLVIQRNVFADVPYRFFEVLKSSVHGSVDWNQRTNEITETQVTRFPIDVDFATLPSPAEIAAWRERTNQHEAS